METGATGSRVCFRCGRAVQSPCVGTLHRGACLAGGAAAGRRL